MPAETWHKSGEEVPATWSSQGDRGLAGKRTERPRVGGARRAQGTRGEEWVGRQCQLIRPDQLAAEKSEEECSLLRHPAGDRRALP